MNDYIRDAIRTESRPDDAMRQRLCAEDTIRLLHAAIGKATEAGELLDALKKHIFYGKPLDMVNVLEEVGDGFWYDAIICDVSGVTFQQIQERNIAKLRARYPQKFEAEQAINRDLDAERRVLEGQ